jgi:hypothetical protein
LDDIAFFKGKKHITHTVLTKCASIEEAVELLDTVTLTWTTQKNGVRGEQILHHKNSGCPGLCPIYQFVRIVHRFIKLMGHKTDIPLSVYRGPTGVVYNVVCTDIDSVFQSMAIRHFKLDVATDKATIAKWTSHSLRVGACNILFGAGTHETTIKFRLRWRSMSFMNYFHNLGAISQEQNNAVNMAIDHPDLFY